LLKGQLALPFFHRAALRTALLSFPLNGFTEYSLVATHGDDTLRVVGLAKPGLQAARFFR
jgi:hypothetical protein